MQQTSVHGRTTSCCKTGWENRTWWSPAPSSGSTTWPQWKERSFFQDHLWVIWTMEAGITTFVWFLVCALWLLLSQWLSCLVQFHLRGRGWTNFSPLFNDWDDTGPPPICTSRLWVTWDIYMWDLLWHREAVLSGLGTFWKRSVSRSFLGVFLGCVGLVLVGLFRCFCVCVVLKTPCFLLSPILQHVGIAYLRQNVLMTVWASSAHGMSSKKGDSTGAPCAYNFIPQTTESLGFLSMFTLASAADPRLVWPSCLWRQNINHFTGHATDICPW